MHSSIVHKLLWSHASGGMVGTSPALNLMLTTECSRTDVNFEHDQHTGRTAMYETRSTFGTASLLYGPSSHRALHHELLLLLFILNPLLWRHLFQALLRATARCELTLEPRARMRSPQCSGPVFVLASLSPDRPAEMQRKQKVRRLQGADAATASDRAACSGLVKRIMLVACGSHRLLLSFLLSPLLLCLLPLCQPLFKLTRLDLFPLRLRPPAYTTGARYAK